MTAAGRGAGAGPRAAALEEADRALLSEYAGCVATLLAALDESGPATAAGPGGSSATSEAERLASLCEASLGARARLLARTREALARSAGRSSRQAAGTFGGGRA